MNYSAKHFIKNVFTKATTALLASALFISSISIPAKAAEAGSENISWPEAPEVVSTSCILVDADTGSILFEKNAHEKSYPASTTKILTGLLTIENCNMSDTITFSQAAANSINPAEDANLGTKTGEQYTVEQALYGLLLYSANEIAYGLAEQVAGTLPAFVEMMNKKAQELGATDTHFANASGLYDANHYTTAFDMAMIARGCYNNASFVNIDSTPSTYTIPATNKSAARYFKHRHKMLKDREFYYEYCKGGKTGFTDESQYTLVTFAEKEGMRLICVVFMEPDDATRYVDTKALFDWGFNNFQKSTTSGTQVGSKFSNSNYYNSKVFSNKSLKFDLAASFITIPNKSSTNAVSMAVDNNYSMTNENGILTSHLKYLYGDNTVGTTKLSISAVGTGSTSLLPVIEENSHSSYKPKTMVKVNLWILVICAGIVFSVIYIASEIEHARKRRHHYNKARGRRRRR